VVCKTTLPLNGPFSGRDCNFLSIKLFRVPPSLHPSLSFSHRGSRSLSFFPHVFYFLCHKIDVRDVPFLSVRADTISWWSFFSYQNHRGRSPSSLSYPGKFFFSLEEMRPHTGCFVRPKPFLDHSLPSNSQSHRTFFPLLGGVCTILSPSAFFPPPSLGFFLYAYGNVLPPPFTRVVPFPPPSSLTDLVRFPPPVIALLGVRHF